MATGFSSVLEKEIEDEARELDLAGSEYTPLLFLIARGFTRHGRQTPFGNAVTNVLEAHGIDPDQVASALEVITKACAFHDERKARGEFQAMDSGEREAITSDSPELRNWQKLSIQISSPPGVSIEEDRDTIFLDVPPIGQLFQSAGRAPRDRVSALGKYRGLTGGSEQFAEEKKSEIEREDRARR